MTRAPRAAAARTAWALALVASFAQAALPLARAATPRADWGLSPVPPRPWLGISVTEIESETPAAPGLTLARVQPGSPAAAAGLLPGDVLLAVDGRVVEGPAALKEILRAKSPGDALKLTMLRGAVRSSVDLTLAAAPGSQPERRVQRLPPTEPPRDAEAPFVVVAPRAGQPGGVGLRYLGDSRRASLGVETLDLEPGLARYFGVAPGEGLLVESVAEGSAAAAAGLRAGDVLLALGGAGVGSGAALAQELRRHAPGERVALAIQREGRRLELTTVLGGESVPEWRVERASAPAPAIAAGASQAGPLTALVQHHEREIARLESLLAAQRGGDAELEALLETESRAARRVLRAGLDDRLATLRREKRELEEMLASRSRR